jgi:hypothetical protein
MVMDPLTARCVTAVYHYRKVIPLEQNNPKKSENKTIRDEFIEFLTGVGKNPSLIDNAKHINQMLEKIYNFSIEQKRKENNQTAQEILDRIRGNQSEPSAIFPEDVDAAFVDGVNEGKRLGRAAVRSISNLFSSEDYIDNYSDVDRGER